MILNVCPSIWCVICKGYITAHSDNGKVHLKIPEHSLTIDWLLACVKRRLGSISTKHQRGTTRTMYPQQLRTDCNG